MSKQSMPNALDRLTTEEATIVRTEIASQRHRLAHAAVAKKNRHAAEMTQKKTDEEAMRAAYEKIKNFKGL